MSEGELLRQINDLKDEVAQLRAACRNLLLRDSQVLLAAMHQLQGNTPRAVELMDELTRNTPETAALIGLGDAEDDN